MFKYRLITILLFALILSSQTVTFAQDNNARSLNVNGRGEVKAKPDVAYINISVISQAKTAQAALQDNATRTTNVLNKIKSLLGKDDTVKTSGFNLSPVYDYNQATKKSELTGYSVSNDLVVKTLDLDNLGNLIDATTSVGANRITGPRFDILNKDKYRKDALRLAVKDARDTANVTAEAAGVNIVRVMQLNPNYNNPQPIYARSYENMKAAYDQSSTPIESGDITVSASVNITYQIQ